ncbi:MAG: hypothetical protein C7B44_05165 [Sulfobacillus thermosulfidooxidans]|nr:MAG: hypothetical protein C7B44_05165 [Sulfobacillus thermosulfidooxidans]
MMGMVYIGVDGGASKTEAVLARHGNIVALARTGPSNPQGPVGFEGAMESITQAVTEVLHQADLAANEVDYAVLGLAGADFPEDVAKMTQALKMRLPGLRLRVVNDTQIALVGGSRSGYGIAVICGTATNVLARHPDGREWTIGGLGYEMGDYGGGIDLAREVLHVAFRSAEGRGPKTLLEQGVLAKMGQPDYLALRRAMYFREIHPYAFLALVPLCFEAAAQQDRVAIHLLTTMARALADSVRAAAAAWPVDKDRVEVVTVGSLWNGASDILQRHFTHWLTRRYPACEVHAPLLSPAAGALLMAADYAGNKEREELRRQLVMQEEVAPEA